MTSFVKFTAISGALNEDAPYCYLIEIDQIKILLDCGSDMSFSMVDSICNKIKHITKTVDAILISHSDVLHVGSLPYVYKKLNLNCPIYTTIPLMSFSQVTLHDILISKCLEGPFDLFNEEDITNAFSKCVGLRYNQNFPLAGKGILIMPYSAGHCLGGAIWRIRKDTDDIVYAVNYNHKKEGHLNGCVLDSILRPSILITDTRNALKVQVPRKQRDKELTDFIMQVLRNDGNVLIPVDSCTRALEVAYVLDSFWEANRIGHYTLILLSNQTQKLIEYAKSMLEWAGDSIKKKFESSRENPFDFKYLRLAKKMADVKQYGSAKVVLASLPTLDSGFSKDLLIEWGQNPKNAILFTDNSYSDCVSRTVIKDLNVNHDFELFFQRQQALEGEEMREYTKKEQERLEREAAEEALSAYKRGHDDSDEESMMDGDEDVERTRLIQIQQELYWTLNQFDLYVKDASKSLGFLKQSSTMFPHFERKPKFDDYGEHIKIEDYKKEEKEFENIGKGLDNLAEFEKENIPKKWVTYKVNISLQCKRIFVDFEGLSDGRSIKNILSKVCPKKLILIGGGVESTNHLAQYFRFSPDITNDVYAPSVMENVNVSSSINIYQLKLTDALLSSLHFEKFGDYSMSFITGLIKKDNNPDEMKDDNEASSFPTLDVAQSTEMPSAVIRRPVFVGDARLSEFRKLCNQAGIRTDFYAGDLVCDESVIIKKNHEGELIIDGILSESYFKVRDLLYSQHAIL